jgi:hypothetical protein
MQAYNFAEITNTAKHRCNDSERQIISGKNVREKLLNTTLGNKILLVWKIVHRVLFQKRKKWNSVAVRQGVVTDGNEEKQINEDAFYI